MISSTELPTAASTRGQTTTREQINPGTATTPVLNTDPQHLQDYKQSWIDAAVRLGDEHKQTINAEVLGLQAFMHTGVFEPQFLPTLRARCAELLEISPKATHDRLNTLWVDKTNSANWSVITVDRRHGPDLLFKDTFIPLNAEFARAVPGAHAFHRHGNSGRASETMKVIEGEVSPTGRLTNAWLSELHSPGGHLLFSGIRSGTLSHYAVRNSELRTILNIGAAEELLNAACLNALRKLSETQRARVFEGVPLDLTIVSFDLQTRSAKSDTSSLAIERGIVDEHRSTLLSLRGQHTLQFKGPSEAFDLRVNVQIIPFNFPPHPKSLLTGSGFGRIATERNLQSLQKMNFLAGSYLKSNTAGRNSGQINFLLSEVTDIFESGAYRLADHDPLKINSRLANLAFKLGYEVHFNCRSGKDRTGMFDAEAKFQAIRLASSDSRPPAWDLPITPDESKLLFELAAVGGSNIIQKRNTGLPGNRLGPYTRGDLSKDGLVTRLGLERWAEFKGFSAHADI